MEKVLVMCPCGTKVEMPPCRAGRKKYCSQACKYKYRTRPSGLKYEIKVRNKAWFSRGHVPWSKGLPEHLQPNWKGDEVGYDGIHSWVEKHLGKPNKCEECGSTSKRLYQWSNKSGEYKRDLADWQRLCVGCHGLFDYKNFGKRAAFYA